MWHPLDGAFLKLSRANYHFRTYNELAKGFKNSEPYKVISEVVYQGQTTYHTLRFEKVKEFPIELPLIIGDIGNNLRSALDHLLWQLWLLKNPSFTKNVKFPIWDTECLFNAKSPRDIGKDALNGLTDVQRAAIESLQPYKTRNNALSLLRDVNDSDKHRLITLIGIFADVKEFWIEIDQTNAKIITPMPRVDYEVKRGSKIESGTVFASASHRRLSAKTYMHVHCKTIFDIAFDGSKTADGQLITPSIEAMIIEVSHAITLFEPEFASFGVSNFK